MATASARYAQLQRARNSVLLAAREAARLTIPGLIPQEGASDPHDVAEQPYESLGARGVNNVGAKLLLSQFPPERPFFKLVVDATTAEQMGAKLGEADTRLAAVSNQAMALVETSGSRPLWMEVFRHLIVAGNVLLYHPDDGTTMRVWRLDQYVVRRDAQGRVLEIVIEEQVYPSELADDVRTAVGLDPADKAEADEPSNEAEEKVKLYTFVKRDGDNLIHFEEINNVEVPGSRGTAKADIAGWQALRWQAVPGSDYGRSMVTEYAGDFLSLEEGWKAILQFAAEAARIVTIVDPNSGIDVEELAAAETGDHLTGFVDKVNKLGLDKSADFNVLWSIIQSIERRISQAFLLTANTIRDAERVTAEEIRAVAQELEDAFGGTYSVLSAEAQTPYARRLLYILGKKGQAPEAKALLKNVNTQIVTGFAALGANSEVRAIVEWIDELNKLFGPETVAQRVDFDEVANRTGTGRGITDIKGMLKDANTIANEQSSAMNADVTSKVAPELVKGGMKALQDNPAIQEAINGQAQQ